MLYVTKCCFSYVKKTGFLVSFINFALLYIIMYEYRLQFA